MHNIDHSMQIEDRLNSLLEDASGCELSHSAIRELLHVLSQRDAFDVVGDEEYLFRAVD